MARRLRNLVPPLARFHFGEQLLAGALFVELELLEEAEEQRHEEHGEERRREHAAHDAGTDGRSRAGAGAGGNRERQHTEDERQ